MIVNTIENSETNRVKLHCADCLKTLSLEDYGLQDFAGGIIDLMESRANLHEQRHKTHKPQIYIYKRKPTNAEIRGN